MKRNRNGSKPQPTEIRVWTYEQTRQALPYLASVTGSLREHWLDMQRLHRDAQRLAKLPGRPDRTRLLQEEAINHQGSEALERFHAAQEELKIVQSLVKPKFFVPVHGEYRHMVHHAELAYESGVDRQNVIVCEDGDALTLGDEAAENLGTDLDRLRSTIVAGIALAVGAATAVAGAIGFGVVYNSARIQLSEHARELASLRVLGFTRAEVTGVLLTEIVILTLAAIPLGWAIGYGFGLALMKAFSSDLYRVPFTISPATYATASLVVLAATVASALIIRRRIDKLELVAVLKTRD